MNGKRPGGWVALAWRYYRDPKFDGLSAEAVVLWINALCYCGEQETDGIVPRTVLLTVCYRGTKRPLSVARSLVRAGLWIETAEGFAFPSDTFARWQNTADQRADARARTAERQARFRDKRRVSNASRNGTSVEGAGAVLSTATPVPPTRDVVEIEPDIFTDDHGRLFVRPAPNGQEDP